MAADFLRDLPSGQQILAEDPWVRQTVETIAQNFHPAGIILFGSRANGTARPDSDVDLVVLMDIAAQKIHETQVAIRKLLPMRDWSLDLIILRPETYLRNNGVPNTMSYIAKKYGLLVYG